MNERHIKFSNEHPKLASLYMDLGALTMIGAISSAAIAASYALGRYVIGPVCDKLGDALWERNNKKFFNESEGIWEDRS